MKKNYKRILSIVTAVICILSVNAIVLAEPTQEPENPTSEAATYGQTLGNVPLLESTVGGVPGTWGWTAPTLKPNAGTQEFEAIFTPNDTTNYTAISTMVTVTTVPAAPKVSNARAEVKSGTKLSNISEITYSAAGIDAEPLYGRFIFAEDDVVLHKSGTYRFTFHPESTNYTDIEIQVEVNVSDSNGTGSSGGSSRPAIPTYIVRYDVGSQGKIIAGSKTETVNDGAYPVKPPIIKVDNDMIFLGWSLNGENLVQPGTIVIHEDTVFYAVYETPKGTTRTHRSYIQGYEDGTFRPEAYITRAEAAAILTRADDIPTVADSRNIFSDVAADAWYTPAITAAYDRGLFTGEPDGTFKPENPVTRAEFAAIAARYLDLDQGLRSSFEDCAGHWADGYIGALTSLAVINGYEDGTFRPEAAITRAEAVKIINRMSGRSTQCKFDVKTSFTDLDKDYWAYDQIIEASQTHDCIPASTILD